MKIILLLLVAILGAAYFLPPELESTQSNCDAVNARARKMADIELAKLPANATTAKAQSAIAAAKAQMPSGQAITAIIQAKLPQVPPEAGCAAAYWATQIWPDIRSWAPTLLAARPPG